MDQEKGLETQKGHRFGSKKLKRKTTSFLRGLKAKNVTDQNKSSTLI